jgi:hypothetical protein
MVLCVNFNLWSWVCHLIVYDEVTFYEFKRKKKQDAQVKTWGFIKKRLVFLAPILLACIMTNNLVRVAMTLMKNLFKFRESHLSVQIIYLIKKSFEKHIMQVMVHSYERKENS